MSAYSADSPSQEQKTPKKRSRDPVWDNYTEVNDLGELKMRCNQCQQKHRHEDHQQSAKKIGATVAAGSTEPNEKHKKMQSALAAALSIPVISINSFLDPLMRRLFRLMSPKSVIPSSFATLKSFLLNQLVIVHDKVKNQVGNLSHRFSLTCDVWTGSGMMNAHQGTPKTSQKINPPRVNVASEILAQAFAYLTKNQTDVLQLVNRQFNSLIKHNPARQSIYRSMYAVLVAKNGRIIVQYSKDKKQRKVFASMKHFLKAKQHQNIIVEHTFVSNKAACGAEMSVSEISRKHMQLIEPRQSNIPEFFAYWNLTTELVPGFKRGRKSSDYTGRSRSVDLFGQKILECAWKSSEAVPPLCTMSMLSTDDLNKWLEYENDCLNNPKRLKLNGYGFVDKPDQLVAKLLERFNTQSNPCQYEIIVTGMDEKTLAIAANFTKKNYLSNETFESLLPKTSSNAREQEPNGADYKDADWVLRRRIIGGSWSCWWSTAVGCAAKMGEWITLCRISDNRLTKTIRFPTSK
uniref:Uncharacterized protein n=1 Tax=Ditylenchus dipsaci TaxID=166011 RepID=A0A915CKW9_9BILA